MNLSEFRFACAVASSGSFSAAANACFVTQPTLSNGIARLEHEFGERIFARTTRKVTLTAFGTHILPYLTEVVHANEMLEKQARAFSSSAQRVIRVGLSPVVNGHALGLILESFRHKHPEIGFTLREMSLADLERRLAEALVDFIFEIGTTRKRSWRSIPVYREPLLFVPRAGVPPKTVDGLKVRLADIAGETYVLTPNDACGLARVTRELFRGRRYKLRECRGETLGCQVVAEWAALGIGAAILPQSKLAATHTQAFAIIDRSGFPVEVVITATWRHESTSAPHVSKFAEYLQAAAGAAQEPLQVLPSSPDLHQTVS